jgi:hypothetical protein
MTKRTFAPAIVSTALALAGLVPPSAARPGEPCSVDDVHVK